MYKIKLFLTILFFYFDFSLCPHVFQGHWKFPYFLMAWLFYLEVEEDNLKVLFWLVILAYLLNVVYPLTWWVYLLMGGVIWGMIKFIKFVFLEEVDVWRKAIVIVPIGFFVQVVVLELIGFLFFHWSWDDVFHVYFRNKFIEKMFLTELIFLFVFWLIKQRKSKLSRRI